MLHVGVYAAPLSLLDLTAASGVTSPLRQAYLHPVVPSQQRATVVLFDSMISITVAVETGAYHAPRRREGMADCRHVAICYDIS